MDSAGARHAARPGSAQHAPPKHGHARPAPPSSGLSLGIGQSQDKVPGSGAASAAAPAKRPPRPTESRAATPAELLMKQMKRSQTSTQSQPALPHGSHRRDDGGCGAGGGAQAGRRLVRCPSAGLLTSVYSSGSTRYGGVGGGVGGGSGTPPGAVLGQLGSIKRPGSTLQSGGGGGGGAAHGSAGAHGGREATIAGGFRSEAVELEVKLAEGLQALEEDAPGRDGADPLLAPRRLAIFRALFDRIIERDGHFGALLRRVKAEYEAALTAAAQPAAPQLERTQTELAASQRACASNAAELHDLRRENDALRDELLRAGDKLGALREELHAYEEQAYKMQETAALQAEAEQAALAAELEAELPTSARPGNITPTLGSGRLVHAIAAPPPKPSSVPGLDMLAVFASRDADARAEAEEAAAAAHAEAAAAAGLDEDDEHTWGQWAGGLGESYDDEDEHDDDDDDDESDGDLRGLLPPPAALPPSSGVPNLDLSVLAKERPSYHEEFHRQEEANLAAAAAAGGGVSGGAEA